MTSLAKRWATKANNSNNSGISSSKRPEIKKADVDPLPCNQSPEPEWQYHFCTAHADFNHWRGGCPCSLDDCLLSKILDAGGNIDKMRGLEIGQGVTTDQVIDEWIDTGEPIADLIEKPLFFICMAGYLAKEAHLTRNHLNGSIVL